MKQKMWVLEGLFPRKMAPFYAFVRTQPFLPLMGFIVIVLWVIPEFFWPLWYLVKGWI